MRIPSGSPPLCLSRLKGEFSLWNVAQAASCRLCALVAVCPSHLGRPPLCLCIKRGSGIDPSGTGLQLFYVNTISIWIPFFVPIWAQKRVLPLGLVSSWFLSFRVVSCPSESRQKRNDVLMDMRRTPKDSPPSVLPIFCSCLLLSLRRGDSNLLSFSEGFFLLPLYL